MDPFELKEYRPMLIRDEVEPFDDPDWIFELKLDGISALAYLDRETVLVNRRGTFTTGIFPELAGLHGQVNGRCILHGEITAMGEDGKPDFEAVLRRSAGRGKAGIGSAARGNPVEFVAFDLLYLGGESLLGLPLTTRKDLLQETVAEGGGLSLSRWIPEQGRAFHALTVREGLEGVVGKRKNSLYYPGKRSRDWVKMKHVLDDDFIICGFIRRDTHVASLVLGQPGPGGKMAYRGHTALALSRKEFTIIAAHPKRRRHPFAAEPPKGNESAQWIRPDLVCVVQFAERTAAGGLRQPVFRGLRQDKTFRDAAEPS